MAGRSKLGSQGLVRCGLVIGVLCGGTAALGEQLFMQNEVFGWDRGFGRPFVPQVQHVPTEQSQDGFVVSASGTAIQDTPAGKALKLIEEGQWVQAIQAIESLDATDSKLVIDEQGVLRPLSAMKSALIASMPEEGRRTFCKLNDPAANAKLAQALAADELNDRAQAFKSIVDSYALCDAAASAAEHLGDIRFEQGRFNEAAAYYRFAAEHPAATPDDAGMMLRRLTALSRAEQWVAFDALAEYARFRHPQATVQVAGEDAAMSTLIAGLLESRNEQPDHAGTGSPTRLTLPTSAGLEYNLDLIAEDHLALLRQHAMNNNMVGVLDETIAPLVASDGDRLFTLALGSVAQLNPQTGTDLWRVGDPNETVQKLSQRMYELANGYHQSLVVHEDTLLATLPGKKNDLTAYLVAMSAENGQTRWSSYDMLRRNNEGVVGEPLVIDEVVYFVSYRSTLELTLYAVRLSDGAEVGKLALGSASKGPNENAPAELSPRLTMGQSHLLVQTNNGALIAVDPSTMHIAWAYTQKIRQSGINMMRRRGLYVADATARHIGDVVAKDGLVIAKDTRTNRVVALREYDAAMVWMADSDADSTVVHHDNKHVYVLGEQLVALDRRTGERVWWTPHPGDEAGRPVFTEDACLIAGNLRLCRIDLSTGKLTQYREDVSSPAALHVVGNQLISVDTQRITAIRLP